MNTLSQKQLDRMDELSLAKTPFFFLVDFLLSKVYVYEEQELEKKEVQFRFREKASETTYQESEKGLVLKPKPESLDSYQKGFELVKNNLQLGNSYLANYTRRTPIGTNYSLEDFYFKSKAKYKVFLIEEFVSFSPETFVEIKNNRIYTHPMKGTIDAHLENARELLKENPKEKAEHYTVVDLLRNDLSQIADEVEVEEFQRIDYLKTSEKDLLAMSSEISGTIKPEYIGKIGSMMGKLLPAGSILGAPKKKTLEIIQEAEQSDRGWYTGVAGWFDGENLDSCVLIRFIEKAEGNFYYRSGGGITHQSDMQDEYEEMIKKIYVPIH